MYSSNLLASSSLVFFRETSANMFFILPLRTYPNPSCVVTKGSHANASFSENVNEPIVHVFGTVFPA